MALTKIGATLGGSADVIQVTQNSHGLSLGFPVKVSGNGTYAHASADTAANAEAIGIIIATTTNTMTIALGGRITVDGVLPSGNPAAGTVLFMATSAGKLTATPPTGNNQVVKPMAVVTYLNSEMIMLQHRGEVISTAGTSLADDSIVEAKLDVSNAPSNGLFLQAQSGEGGGLTWAAGSQSFTGDVTITSGNLVIATGNAGKGIDFSANTQSAVSGVGLDSELLDWYEEGTWTPILKDSSGNSASHSTQVGRYTRIGRLVHIQCKIVCNGAGAISNTGLTIYIHGIPFNAQNTVTNLQSSFTVGLTAAIAVSSGVSAAALIEQNGSYLVLLVNDATSGMSNMLFSELSADGQLSIAGSYTV